MSGRSFGGFLPKASATFLEDVEELTGVANPIEDQVMYYDGSKWVNAAIPESADGNYHIIYITNAATGTTNTYLTPAQVINTTIVFTNTAISYTYRLYVPTVLELIEYLELDSTYNGAYFCIYIVNDSASSGTGTVRLTSASADGWTPIDFLYVDLPKGSSATLQLLIHDVDARQGRTFFRAKD